MIKKNVPSRKRGGIVLVMNSLALMGAAQVMSAARYDVSDFEQGLETEEVVGQCAVVDGNKQNLRIITEDKNAQGAYACVRFIDDEECVAVSEILLQAEQEKAVCVARNEVLLQAAEQGDVDRVGEALDAGAHIDCQNEYGNTALMLAALRGRRGVVERLLAAHACVDVRNEYQVNALMLAVIGSHGRGGRMAEKIGYFDIIKQLTLAGARTDLKDKNGNQIRHYANSQVLELVRQV